jgi:integrase
VDACSANPRVKTMLLAALVGCLRRGEIVGLKWRDVDLVAEEISVQRNAVQAPDWEGGDPDTIRKRMKVPKGRRAQSIGMDPVLRDALTEWKADEVAAARGRPDDPVWPGAGGEHMGAGTPGQALARAMRRAWPTAEWDTERAPKPKPGAKPLDHGVPAPPWVTLHGLRHTGASIALADGQALIDVSGQLRHADPGVTAKVYAHLLDRDQLKKVARSIGRAVEASADS